MKDGSSLEDRGRTLEDDYFRKRDAELLQRARDKAARAERAAGELAQARALAAAYGFEFDSAAPELQAAVRRLSDAGVTEDSAPAVELLPAVDVAWQGGVDVAERDRLLAAAGLGAASPQTMDLIAGWCVRRPDREVFEAGLAVLRHRLQALARDERPLLAARVTGACETVATAAGAGRGSVGYRPPNNASSTPCARRLRAPRVIDAPNDSRNDGVGHSLDTRTSCRAGRSRVGLARARPRFTTGARGVAQGP